MTKLLRELKRELLRQLGQRLADFGYPSRPSGQTFYRRIANGRTAIHAAFVEHDEDVDVTVDVAVRLDDVEDLVQRSNDMLSEKEKSETFTLGVELGNLARGEPLRWTVADVADVSRVVEEIVALLLSVGLPYMERYSQPAAAYELLAGNERSAWLHSPIDAERAKRVCALLLVLGRVSDVDDFAAKKLAFLKSNNDPGATAFSTFAAGLRRSSKLSG